MISLNFFPSWYLPHLSSSFPLLNYNTSLSLKFPLGSILGSLLYISIPAPKWFCCNYHSNYISWSGFYKSSSYLRTALCLFVQEFPVCCFSVTVCILLAACYLFIYFFSTVLRIKTRALHMLCKHFIMELYL